MLPLKNIMKPANSSLKSVGRHISSSVFIFEMFIFIPLVRVGVRKRGGRESSEDHSSKRCGGLFKQVWRRLVGSLHYDPPQAC